MATPNQFGNAGLKLPSFGETVPLTVPGQIFQHYPVDAIIEGATLLADQGILPAGCALGYQSATKKYVLYDNAGSGGAETCKGFLLEKMDTTDADCLANIVLGGALKNSALSGADSNAITDLNARVDTERDLFVF